MTENIIIKPSVQKRFDSFMAHGRVLFFSAPCGFGKTVLADALLRGRNVLRQSATDPDCAIPPSAQDWDILLIDDLQLMQEEAGQQALCELIRSSPERHFVLLSRGVPPGCLTAFQYTGLMTVLEADDLLFDADDVRRLFQLSGANVTDSEIDGILKESVGYPLGVAITARCMSPGKPWTPELVARVFREVFLYFETAIYRRFDLPVRRFLLELAPFESFDLEMARMVSGDPRAGERLDWLLRYTTMLRYDDCQRFRFWSGFRAFLRWEMEREYTEEKRKALFSRGGLYYELKEDYTYGQTPSTPTLTDRTGDLNAQVTYSYAAADSGSVQTWDISNPPALNAGTYRMFARIGATSNYYEYNAEYCEFVVAKATPPYTKPTGLTAKYGQTLADVTLTDGWSWMDSSESVGGASTAAKTFQAKFTPTDAVNYNMVENIGLEVMVNKADGGNLKTVELEQKYTDASDHTYTPDWAGLPAGQDWTFSSEASIVLPKQDFAADGNLLTYAISGGKAGDKITIILKASCNNYEDCTITLTITLTEKDNQQALRITGGTTVVYGQTLQLGTSGGTGSGAVTYTVTNGTGEATIDSNGVLTPVRIGSVTVTATKAGDSEYNAVTSSPVEITITRATPTGEPAYTKITASGKTLADAALGIGTITPAGGTIAWDDPTTTEVVANKSYGWTYTPTDTNYTTRTGTIKLWSKSSGGGSGRTAAVVAPDMPMLYRGCTDDAVKTLQEKLNAKGFDSGNVDGIFGAKTYAAVTAFQKANGLGVDGIVGKLTWGKLYGVSPAMPVETTTVVGRPMVSYGSRGDAVRKLQELLNALGYDCGSVDGIFGSKTKTAVLAFQNANGLGTDGIVGPLTWGKLV